MTDSNLIRVEQAAILAAVAAKVRDGFAGIHPTDPSRSFPALAALATTLTNRYGAAAATQAIRHYSEARTAAGVVGSYTPRPANPAPLQRVTGMTSWAVRGLRVAPDTVGTPPPPTEEAIRAAERDLVAGVERLVLEQARKTTVENVQRDRKARAWARETRPGCCAFCALMSSRGPIYASEDTAGRDANASFTGTGEFKFHDNCVVPGTLVSGPATHTGYRRHYEGELITLVTAAGHELSITPKHPVLTDRGWVLAGNLNVGDHLVSARSGDRNVVSGPDVNHVPARIEDVVGALGMVSAANRLRVPGTAEQFHGDGFTSEVDVVTGHYLLRDERQATLLEPFAELDLHRATSPGSLSRAARACLRELEAGIEGLCAASRSVVGAFSESLALFGAEFAHADAASFDRSTPFEARILEPAHDRRARHPMLLRDGQDALPFGVTTGNVGRHGQPIRGHVGVSRKFDPPPLDGDPQTLRVFAERGADLRVRLSGSVHLDRLLDKRTAQYHGDVLNLETSEGWYSANGITVSNCHCVAVPVFGNTYRMTPTALAAAEAYKNRGKGDALNAFRRTWEDRNRPEGFKPRIPR